MPTRTTHACAHLHGAQLSSEGRAHTARKDDGCDHRCELTGERECQHTAHTAGQAQLGELAHKLRERRSGYT